MILILPLISKSPSLFSKLLGTLPRAPITIGTIDTFIFHTFFSNLVRSWYLSIFYFYFIFTLSFAGTAQSTRWQQYSLFFFLINRRSSLLTRIGWSIYISKSQRILCLIFWDRFLSKHISMAKFLSLAQFPVNYLFHSVRPTVVFLLCPLAIFPFYHYYYYYYYSLSFYTRVGWRFFSGV